MRDMLVLTIIGPDKPGLVDALAREIATLGGNWEESRLVRLAGQFAGVLLVTIETARTDQLMASVRKIAGLTVQVHPAGAAVDAPPAAPHYTLAVTGNDRPGIIRDIAAILAERNINVEDLHSEVASAPMSGDMMFTARFEIVIPSSEHLGELRTKLESLAGEITVDLDAI